MKKLFIFLVVMTAVVFVSETNAQTKIVFAGRASSKTMTVTIPANGEKSFSVRVKKNQVINVNVSGDIYASKTDGFPLISLNLIGGVEGIDNWQDGEGYLSILAGNNGNYSFSVSNSGKRSRTFTLKVFVTNNREDYLGGQ